MGGGGCRCPQPLHPLPPTIPKPIPQEGTRMTRSDLLAFVLSFAVVAAVAASFVLVVTR